MTASNIRILNQPNYPRLVSDRKNVTVFVRGKLPRVTLAALLSDSEDEELEEELSSKEVSDELEGVGARLDDFAFFLGGGTGMSELSAIKWIRGHP